MATIILIHPKTGMDIKGLSINLPLALLFISSNLCKAGHDVRIIDQRLEEDWPEKLETALLEKPLCVGVTAITGGQIKWGLAASKIVKEINPDIPVVWGGIHPSLLPEQTIRHPLVDVVVTGYAEETFASLVEVLAGSGLPAQIPGVFWKDSGKIIGSPRPPDIPTGTYDLPFHLIDIGKYFCNLYRSANSLDVLASRGCPHGCIFCYNLKYNAGRYHFFEPEWIISNIEYVKKQGAQTISLISDNFFTDRSRVVEFCDLFRKKDIQIDLSANCRIDYLVRFGKNFLEYLRGTGFTEIFVGIESGSDRILKAIGKNTTREQALLGNELLRSTGITPIYSFMGGFPGETVEDVKMTLGIMQELRDGNPDAYLTPLKIVTPFPGTKLYDICLKAGFTPPDTLEGWSDFYFNKANFQWGSAREMSMLEKISYITYFLDQKSMPKHFGKNPLISFLISLYGKILDWRLKRGWINFFPEYLPLKKLYQLVSKTHFGNFFKRD